MRTIKTYFKGAPFYIASASRDKTILFPPPEFTEEFSRQKQGLEPRLSYRDRLSST